ncbi:formyltransferase family protein [Desulfobotulus sp.]|uniref:formyltransferase family protein n=1 Tax=Desulfobotulus sp. TaxID=1940337 RepID=UPI002A35EF0F|nr:formyltransferase family protein [Desulfobotulus sp.]MDY0164434.1 formyltransferase family protein [Desulfobotulus sp.]
MTPSPENILFLGPPDSPLILWLENQGENVISTTEKIDTSLILNKHIDFLISYGYRHILKKNILDLLPDKAINLHISLLPWNRGADPNFWSFAEKTPKGVSIHLLDPGLDTGDILLQKEVFFDSRKETLASSYEKLHHEIQRLFMENWLKIKTGQIKGQKQQGQGSFHRLIDKESLFHRLPQGWETSASIVESLYSHERKGP